MIKTLFLLSFIIEIEIEIVFIILKSTQNFSKRKAVTVRKKTILDDALLTPRVTEEVGSSFEGETILCGLVFSV